ncbi:MAG: FIST C-terminal domain-containing protein [Oligoflexales bacterium]|nr:FIST C-terminal domain-containing protein [Oligoflexales bacterium]
MLTEHSYKEFPKAAVMGCSSEGVLVHGIADESNFSLGVMLFQSDEIKFAVAGVDNVTDDYDRAGSDIAVQVNELGAADTKAMIVFTEGLKCSFDGFLRGFNNTTKNQDIKMFGGLAADNFSMKETFQYYKVQAMANGISCLLLQGDFEMNWAVSHGCRRIGNKRTITKCDKNVILEIDNKPVLEVLKEYLSDAEIDDWSSTVVSLCLGFPIPEDLNLSESEKEQNEFLIRFIPSKDDEQGSITIPTGVSVGTELWMSTRDEEKLIENCLKSVDSMLVETKGETPDFLLQFECGGRGKFIIRSFHQKMSFRL